MKFMMLPMDAFGHVNACIGLARMLRSFGHESIFVLPKNWSNLVTGHQFTVEPIKDPEFPDENADPLLRWADIVAKLSPSFKKSPFDQIIDLFPKDTKDFCDYVKRINNQVAQIISKINPDFIIVDFYVTVPSVVKSGKPWFLLYSCNPLFAYDRHDVPPRYSGLGASDDPTLFANFRSAVYSALKELKADFDQYLIAEGLEPHPVEMVSTSPYLNLYQYPSDIDYSEFGPVPDKWFRLDHMVRVVDDGQLGFDESFFQTSNKIVFFSLGSMGSADVDLMKRLIGIMAKSPYRFIISKGPYHDKIDLSDNMIGGRYVNQMKVLPKVDGVITHGGNNTFLETLYFGKPLIVLPLWNDQHDNARRTVDTGIGRAYQPYTVSEVDLIKGIDDILTDQTIIQKVAMIGENMRKSKSFERLSERLEQIVHESKV